MDILEQLTQEHRDVELLLAQLADGKPGRLRYAIVAELESSLDTHMRVEERFLYPIVERVVGPDASYVADRDHDLARAALDEACRLLDDPRFGAAIAVLSASLSRHVDEEEARTFPALRQAAAHEIAALDRFELRDAVRHERLRRPGA